MRPSTKFVLIASLLLASALAWGQSQRQPAERTSLLARLSFTSTWIAGYGQEGFPQICFSVDHTGYYRMRRLTTKGETELLQGTLPPGELGKLEKLLGDSEFRSLAGSSGGILRKGAEAFVAEVPREQSIQRVVMSDTDGENPLPRSVGKIVGWLQRFKPKDAEPLDGSTQDICPSGVLRPVQPATAALEPIS
jgi:hypothetical protein